MQGPILGVKLATMGLIGLASLVCPGFVEASPTVEKAVSCYKANRLIASLLGFCSVQSSLAAHKFRAAEEEHCKEATDGCVQTFDAQCHVAQSASEQLQLPHLSELSGPIPSDSLCENLAWWAVTWRTLKNHKTVGGWALARVWVLARDSTVTFTSNT